MKIPNHLPWSRRGHLLSSQGGPRNLALLSLLVRLPVRVLFPSNRHPHLVSLQLSPVEEALPQLPRLVGPTHLCGTEEGSYLSLIDSCITQLKAQGPSRTCNESKGGGVCLGEDGELFACGSLIRNFNLAHKKLQPRS